jgi:hypothetical protein
MRHRDVAHRAPARRGPGDQSGYFIAMCVTCALELLEVPRKYGTRVLCHFCSRCADSYKINCTLHKSIALADIHSSMKCLMFELYLVINLTMEWEVDM